MTHDPTPPDRRPPPDAGAAGDTADTGATAERDRAALAPLVAALPRSLEPPRDLWPAIGARLPARPAPRRRSALLAARWPAPAVLAAAALVAALSSATTAWLMAHRAAGPPAPAVAGALAPEARYLRTAAELTRAFEARRDELTPETRATLERNLAVIDQAIAESRAALARDPADRDLAALLYAGYEQKVALLRRALDLPRRS